MTENRTYLTVLIPTFNRYDMLIDLLKRLENEDRKKIRILISDNCSEDIRYTDLKETCKQHPLNIQVFRHEEAITVNRNFEFLLSKVETEFSCYLADDDYWELGALSKMVTIMVRDDIDFSYSESWFVHDSITRKRIKKFHMHLLI